MAAVIMKKPDPYLPDLNDYSLTVEVFFGLLDEVRTGRFGVCNDFHLCGSFAACGLMEELSENLIFPPSTYHCSCRAYFRGTKIVIRLN